MTTRYTAFLISTALLSTTFGQTITNADNSPQPGDAFLIHNTSYQATTGGSFQTWDLSGMTIDNSQTLLFVTPSTFPNSGSFPGATVAIGDGSENTYFMTNSGEFSLVGSESGAIIIPYTDPARIISYPASMGSTWTDNLLANFTVSGTAATRTGTYSGSADGFGNLIMPFGTVENVLRVHLIEDYQDQATVMGIPVTIEYDNVIDWFMKPGVRMPIVMMSIDLTTNLGTQTADTSGQYMDGDPATIGELLNNSIGIEAYPNPATDQVQISFGASASAGAWLELYDMTGKLVVQHALGRLGSGIHQHQLDVDVLPPGIYLLRIHDANGDAGQIRLTVE